MQIDILLLVTALWEENAILKKIPVCSRCTIGMSVPEIQKSLKVRGYQGDSLIRIFLIRSMMQQRS